MASELCPCFSWAIQVGESFSPDNHHPKCDGAGQWKQIIPANNPAVTGEVIALPIIFNEQAVGYFLDGNGDEIDASKMKPHERREFCEFIAKAINSHAEVEQLRRELAEAKAEIERLRAKSQK